MALTKDDKEYIQMLTNEIKDKTDENTEAIAELTRLLKGSNGNDGLVTQFRLLQQNCIARATFYPVPLPQPTQPLPKPETAMNRLQNFLLEKIVYVVIAFFGLAIVQMVLDYLANNNIKILH